MGSALDTALLKRSRPEIVDYLVNHGAKVDGYWLKVKPKEKKIVIERWTKLARTVPGNILHPKLTRNQWLQLLKKEGDLKNLQKKGQFVEPSKIPKSLLTPSPASSQSFLRTPSRKNLAGLIACLCPRAPTGSWLTPSEWLQAVPCVLVTAQRMEVPDACY